jgi:LysR family transcriptional regulator (chromosome initiation inhibitor)
VLRQVADWPDTVLRLFVEDQGHSSRLLRSGAVLGAVTSDPVAVQGCSVIHLGAMRYRPMAAARLLDRFGGPGAADWGRLPVVRFNDKDDLQHRMLADQDAGAEPPVHLVPSSQAFLAAVQAGLGWGMVPENQLDSGPESAGRHAADDGLVLIAPGTHIDIPLYWQVWRLRSPRIEKITAAIRQAAGGLLPPAA